MIRKQEKKRGRKINQQRQIQCIKGDGKVKEHFAHMFEQVWNQRLMDAQRKKGVKRMLSRSCSWKDTRRKIPVKKNRQGKFSASMVSEKMRPT